MQRLGNILFTCICGGLLLGMGISEPSSFSDEATMSSGADTLMTFQRTACFGPCPEYSLVVYEDGRMLYQGESEVKVEGNVQDTLDTCQLSSLREAFAEADFFEFRRSYTSGSICEEVLMDAPTVRTFYRENERFHRVVHYRGCRGFPERQRLIELENQIDRILKTAQYTGVER